MPTMVKCKCASCGAQFEARLADRRRGWGKFCSKSCKAVKQAKRDGGYTRMVKRMILQGHEIDPSDSRSGEMFPSMSEGEVQ